MCVLLSFALLRCVSIYISHLLMSASHIYPCLTFVFTWPSFSNLYKYLVLCRASDQYPKVLINKKKLPLQLFTQDIECKISAINASVPKCPYHFSHILQLYILYEKTFFTQKQREAIIRQCMCGVDKSVFLLKVISYKKHLLLIRSKAFP